jgi:nucleoside-diphosphate-sugar epimerase
VGSGEKQVDATYIDNVVDAHLLAAYKLEPGATCAGKAYFITNDEPWLMVDILNGILSAGGLPALDKHIPEGVAYALGATLETIYGLLKITKEPPMTRFVARQLATAHWYDISAAKRDLDYGADVSMDEGMQRLAEAMETNT